MRGREGGGRGRNIGGFFHLKVEKKKKKINQSLRPTIVLLNEMNEITVLVFGFGRYACASGPRMYSSDARKVTST